MKLYFNIEYHAKPGERLELIVDEKDSAARSYMMFHTENGLWKCEVDFFFLNQLLTNISLKTKEEIFCGKSLFCIIWVFLTTIKSF